MISIRVADNQLWLLRLNDSYQYECWSAIMDYKAHISMIIIRITHVITDYYKKIVWISGNISVCLAIRVCTTYKAVFFIFLLLKWFLLYFFSGQINNLYV